MRTGIGGNENRIDIWCWSWFASMNWKRELYRAQELDLRWHECEEWEEMRIGCGIGALRASRIVRFGGERESHRNWCASMNDEIVTWLELRKLRGISDERAGHKLQTRPTKSSKQPN